MLTPALIQDILNDPQIDAAWQETLAEWEDAVPSQVRATLAYARGLRNQVLQLAREVDDAADLERMLALHYIELKCQWTKLNALVQYRLGSKGEVREDLMYRASCVSQLLSTIEPLLDPQDVDGFTNVLSAPIGATREMAS
ncbi:MAG: hypothetical protein AAGG50_09130 [Bacteroidota bacterium]